ncbi:MAG TPA: hypothetical protein VK459_12485 [Polyangiaceae bacterium]|nr:hypothetical protein [Polyangiaceae bacterium]
MMICNIVTEGKLDAEIVRKLLEPEIRSSDRRIHFTCAGGWSLAESTARSILAVRQEPVALIVNADSSRIDRIEERRRFLEESLREVATGAVFHVVLFVPEIEVLFFHPDVISQLLGTSKELSDAERTRAEYEPKRVLESLGLSRDVISRKLPRLDLTPVKAHTDVAELRSFVLGVNEGRSHKRRARAS